MNKLFLSLSLLLLSLCVACGSGSNNLFNQGSGTGTGHFSNSSLKGQYAYQLSGVDLTQNPAQTIFEAGSFTADGGGKITAGVDDFALGTAVSSGTLTGSYSVASDGTGTIVLTSSSGRSFSFAITLASTSKVYLVTTGTIDADNGAGVAELQSSTAFSTPPSGTFVFRVHEIGSTSIARVGTINIGNGGAVTSGTEDVNDGGSSSTLSLSSGLFNTPDSNGRGTGTLTDSNGTFTFAYYVVTASSLRLFSTTSGIEGNGRAEVQSAQFSSDPISGNSYAFGSRGDDAANIGAVNTVGRFTASSGTISAGAYDAVQDSSPSSNVGFTGSYTWTPNGRVAISLSTGVQQIVWMVSSSRGFFVTTANPAVTADVEDGTMDMQQGSAFSAASLKGQFAFFMDGYDAGAGFYIDRVGWIQWDGSSALSLFEFLNESGTASNAGPLAGAYAVSANGRAAASISGIGSSNSDVVLYLISGTDAYILENDSLVEINGMMSQQVQ